ncbi:bifunctional lysylphosphatidylglycerol flippase/synthetase MprF [Streptomyces daliensis]|uniref:DUF2156 domain-containing protein n=1 Tax=Streptomyces daliensis TaxID=299421 RepID=A0A8T4IWC3_9ACTN|nr:DUF2156 domain-containing protein [Streptomyces daliensis]
MGQLSGSQAETAEYALRAVQGYGENPSSYLALNRGNQLFTASTGDVIAYRESGRYLVQFAGVLGPWERKAQALREFKDYARAGKRRIACVQLQSREAELYASEGFTINQVGSSYSVHLPDFTLRGSRFMKLRNKISQARRSGLQVEEVSYDEHVGHIEEIDRFWLRSKGKHTKEIRFLVGEVGGPAQKHRRLFMATDGRRPTAYISYSPVFGERPGWLHDLSRRRHDARPGAAEAINATALELFMRERAEWLHFGFTPFTGLDAAHMIAPSSPLTGAFMRLLAERGEALYPAASQLSYKKKWHPHLVTPEYLAFEGRARPGAIWQLLRVTNTV